MPRGSQMSTFPSQFLHGYSGTSGPMVYDLELKLKWVFFGCMHLSSAKHSKLKQIKLLFSFLTSDNRNICSHY